MIGLPPDTAPPPDGPVVVKPKDGMVDTTPPPDTVPNPDQAVPPCTSHADCDDGLSCTADICGVGGCANIITGNACVIQGKCVPGLTANPARNFVRS